VGRLFLCSTADDMKDTNSTLIRLNDLDLKFSKDVKKMSGTDFHTCSIPSNATAALIK
jgi:hypothetical protein